MQGSTESSPMPILTRRRRQSGGSFIRSRW
jgi:hypothetical protein